MNGTRLTVKQMFAKAKANGQTSLMRFMRDMRKAGLRMYHYKGRFWWEGPAVDVDDLQTAMSATKVPVQWDSMGLGYVVYPKQALRS